MTFSHISFERRDATAWLVLDRPAELNCLSPTMVDELNAALDLASNDREIRCLVLTGRGRAFCAGADLKFVGDFPEADREVATARFLRQATDLVCRIESFSKPVVAAVNGIATAGGMELVLGCDLVLAARGARLGDGHANYGLLPGAGASARLPRRIGLNHAKYLMFTGELISASDPIFASLISAIVSDGDLEEAATRLAAQIVSKSALGIRHMKELLNSAAESELLEAVESELRANAGYSASYDRNEGLAAFRERRTPRFQGR